MLREKFLKKVREMVKKEGERKDLFLAHAIRTLEDLEKVINLLGSRLKEWYSYYFPELEIKDVYKFSQVVLILGRKEDVEKAREKLEEKLGEGLANKVVELAKNSVGGSIEEEDLEYIKMLAKEIISLIELKEKYEEDLDKISSKIAPNLTYLVGGKIAAKLIEHANGLEKLSLMPASTIQVLGAEKALFKYLRKKAKRPPKHGILLLHPYVNSLPKKLRGKMARTLASKLSIAIKADATTKKFIAKELKEELEERWEELKKLKDKVEEKPHKRKKSKRKGGK